MADAIEFEVLGPLRALAGGRDLAPRGARLRRLLAILVLRRNQVVSDAALSDALWPDRLPADHRRALQTQVYRLRQTLAVDCVTRTAGGYRLDVEPDRIDAVRFEAEINAATAHRATDPAGALPKLDDALGRWRGTPYEELGDVDDATIETGRLAELRLRAIEERFECCLLAGRHDEALPDLDAFATRHPLRERPQTQLMAALRQQGRLADALAVYDRYRRALAQELGIDPSPPITALHDEIVVGAEAGNARPPSTPAAPRPSGRALVPRHTSTFVGRDDLVDELGRLIGEHRVVTLVGTGGVGKTRLATEVGTRLEPAFRDGVWFCTLADTAPGGVALSVAATLGIEQRAGEEPADRLADVLAHHRSLIVLDNCEHVLDEAAVLAEVVSHRAPHVSILVTSRERLNIDGEHLLPVPPLPLVDAAGVAQPAVALFLDRAGAVRSDWEPTSDDLEVAAGLCRRLAGLPLAIELAAARLHTHTLDEVVAGLDSELGVLVGGRRTVWRHRSLAAAIGWSYDLLSSGERVVFNSVSVFRAPFTAAGAAAVSGHGAAEAADLLAGLIERSMLHRSGQRYGMLEPLREFGRERLAEQGRLDEVVRAHAFHLRDLLAASERRLRDPDELDALDDVDRSIPDAEMAFRTLVSSGEADAALDICSALHDYGLHRMRHEVLGWAETAAELAIASGCRPERIADAFGIAAFGAWKRGDFGRYEALTDEALRWSERAGLEATARTADALSTFTLVSGRLDEAYRWTAMAEEMWSDAGDAMRAAEAGGVHLLAIAYGGGDAVDAAERMVRGLDDRSPGPMAAFAWYVAGEVLVDSQPDVAGDRLRRAVELAAACGSHFVQGIAGSSAASVEARWGDPHRAIEYYRWLLPHWRRAGVHSLAWTTLRSVAELLGRTGAHRPAAVLVGAVTSTRAGHEVFGADADRLAALGATLRDQLGPAAFEAAAAEGAGFSDGDAAAFALSTFDQL